jgi:ABC-type bacteriocin/lantibiotic exporter with double-glycine peptidase domain
VQPNRYTNNIAMPSKPPFHSQELKYSCVPACLRMVLASFGLSMTEAELREMCDCTVFGTEALSAVDAARQLGFAGSVKHNLQFSELQTLVEAGHFPIVYINLEPIDGFDDEHALVITQISGGIVSVHDPLRGEREIPVDAFLSAWRMHRNLTILIIR